MWFDCQEGVTGMSMYYFDFQLGAKKPVERNDNGLEYGTSDLAKMDAAKALLEFAQDRAAVAVDLNDEVSLYVRDDSGLLYTLVFTLSVIKEKSS